MSKDMSGPLGDNDLPTSCYVECDPGLQRHRNRAQGRRIGNLDKIVLAIECESLTHTAGCESDSILCDPVVCPSGILRIVLRSPPADQSGGFRNRGKNLQHANLLSERARRICGACGGRLTKVEIKYVKDKASLRSPRSHCIKAHATQSRLECGVASGFDCLAAHKRGSPPALYVERGTWRLSAVSVVP